MGKRNLPKKWYEDRLRELFEGMNDLNTRLKRVEGVVIAYLDMKKDRKKLEKFFDKQKKEEENGG